MKKKMDLSQPIVRSLRIYPHIDVTLNYQNFGSVWRCILRGKTEDIEKVFNAFYNYGATNGDFQFFDHVETVAIFWSSDMQMERFFYNFRKHSESTRHLGKAVNRAWAGQQMTFLREHCHEVMRDYLRRFEKEPYKIGSIRAERPDGDFKDAVMEHAFADR